MGNGIHTAGGRSGNDNHYVEQHEKGDKALKKFQKKVKHENLHSETVNLNAINFLLTLFPAGPMGR